MKTTYLVRHTEHPIFIESVEPLAVTPDVKSAQHFATRAEAKEVASTYGFKVVTHKVSDMTQEEFERLEAQTVEIWD